MDEGRPDFGRVSSEAAYGEVGYNLGERRREGLLVCCNTTHRAAVAATTLDDDDALKIP